MKSKFYKIYIAFGLIILAGFAYSVKAAYITTPDTTWTLSGTNLFPVSTSYNVGIGTTSPAHPLDVNGNILARGANILFADLGTTNREYIVSNDSGISGLNTLGVFGFFADTSLGGAITSPTAGISAKGIYSNGYVGIGIASPNKQLHVYSTSPNAEIDIQSVLGAGNQWGLYNEITDNSLRVWGGDNYVSIKRDGKIGIGTTNPGVKLDVVGEGLFRLNDNVSTYTLPANIYSKENYDSLTLGRQAGTGSEHYVTALRLLTIRGANTSGARVAFINDNVSNRLSFGVSDSGLSTERLVIKTNGNVGIGTTNPNAILTITSPGAVSGGRINFRSDRTDLNLYENGHILYFNAASGLNFNFDSNSNASGAFNINEAGTSRLYVEPGGNVGIGTTNPEYKLDVNGTVRFNNYAYGLTPGYSMNSALATVEYVNAIAAGTSTVPTVGYWTASGNNIYSANSGNVGIGTTAPSSKFDVRGGVNITGASSFSEGIRLHAVGGLSSVWFNAVNSSGYDPGMFGITADSTGMRFRYGSGASPSDLVNILNNGNVGIGTASPGYKLDVYSPSSLDAYLRVQRQGTTKPVGITLANDTVNTSYLYMPAGRNDLRFYTGGDRMTILNSNGNVGIGTTNPTGTFHVNRNDGSVIFEDGASGQAYFNIDFSNAGSPQIGMSDKGNDNAWAIGADDSDNSFKIAGGTLTSIPLITSNTKMTILANGNVGIGTTAPDASLSVRSASQNAVVNIFGVSSTVDYGVIQVSTSGGLMNPNNRPLILQPNAGNVGIGTTNPQARLDLGGGASGRIVGIDTNPAAVRGDSDVVPKKWIVDNFAPIGTGAGSAFVQGGNSFGTKATLGTNDSQTLAFETAGAERMTILSNGNVGIGTAAPGSKLEVAGTVMLGSNTVSKGLYVDSSGNVGIGTEGGSTVEQRRSGPYSSLDIYGPDVSVSTDATAASVLRLSRDIADPVNYQRKHTAVDFMLSRWQDYANYPHTRLDFRLSGSPYDVNYPTIDVMSLRSDGSVGIGTTAPASRLNISETTGTVHGASTGSLIIDHENSGGASSIVFRSKVSRGSDYGYIQYQDSSTVGAAGELAKLIIGTSNDGTDDVVIMPTGSFGINTMGPGYKLDAYTPSTLDAYYRFQRQNTTKAVGLVLSDATVSRWYLQMPTGSNDFHINSGSTNRFTILNSNGYVGIGTTSPTEELHVIGDAKISRSLYASGASLSGNLLLNENDITGVNKLTVMTIDPLYRIKGINYSTFAPSFVGGVKEEIAGKIKIEKKVAGEYQAVIDFSKVSLGSDLWVWYNVIDFNKESVEVSLTPYGGFANTYYYIDGKKLVLKADRPVEVSYRLTAKRFDWKEWPTKAIDQNEKPGFIID